MITVCQFYNDFKGASNTWAGGHFRPKSFEYALHEASIEIFNQLRKEWEKSQIIPDNLRPFITSVQISIKDFPKGGMVAYPKDYSTFSSLRFYSKTKKGAGVLSCDMGILDKDNRKCRELRPEEQVGLLPADELIERTITKIDNQRWGSVMEDEFVPPTLDDSYCTQYNDGFKVLPKQVRYVVLDYLAIPERPKFIYTMDDDDNIICDAGQCTNLLWGDEILPELMSRVKTKYASFVGNAQKYAEGQKETEIVGS